MENAEHKEKSTSSDKLSHTSMQVSLTQTYAQLDRVGANKKIVKGHDNIISTRLQNFGRPNE